MKLKIQIPASTGNVGPGFDCLSLGLNIYNHYEFETHTKTMQQHCHTEKMCLKPENNLILKAYQANCQLYSLAEIPFHCRCYSKIPISIGLGTSANAILAGVLLSRIVHGKTIEREQVLADASKLEPHLDNLAGSLYGGFNITMQEGNNIQNFNYPVAKELHCILLQPSGITETLESRKKLPQNYSKDDVVYNLSRCSLLSAAFVNQDFSLLKFCLEDRLHQPYRFSSQSNIEELKTKLKGDDFFGLALSGSGPSLIIFCSKISQRILCVLDDHFSAKKKDFKIMHLKVDNRGATVES